jgi:hypothetical protein
MKLLELHLGQPVHRGALSVFPVWNGNAVADPGYDLHSVEVAERTGAPVVGELVATNTGTRPGLVLAGELLEGGRQHRVAVRSAVIGAGYSEVLEVRCVEQGRWSGGTGQRQGGRRAPASVRSQADQGRVWQRIEHHEQRHGARPTHSVLDAMDAVRDQAASLVAGLRPLPFQTGVLFGVAGRPMLLEAFDSPTVLAEVWDQLLLAAAFDAVGAPARQTESWRARQFLHRQTSVPLQRSAGQVATSWHGKSDTGPVDLLVWDGRVVHAVAANARHELVEV